MKLLIDDTTGRTHNLNANEACVYAAILKCTRAGRGWFANYRDLADALPFVISRMTVSRSVEKLLNLGLIERRDNSLFACAQIEQIGAQNEQGNAQNEQIGAQIEQIPDSPYNPLIINNMNEKEKEQPRALCTHDGNEQQSSVVESFAEFKKQFLSTHRIIPLEFERREASLMKLWNECSEVKRREILAKLTAYNVGVDFDAFKPNPIFFLQDFPEPQPVFLRGDEGGDIVQVRYNGAYKLCFRETMHLFNLEFVRNW